jgi:hypothetical protein
VRLMSLRVDVDCAAEGPYSSGRILRHRIAKLSEVPLNHKSQ